MSRQNKVNPGMYTQRGRLAQDDAAREIAKQRSIGSEHTWQPVKRDHQQVPPSKSAGADDDSEAEERAPTPKKPARVLAKTKPAFAQTLRRGKPAAQAKVKSKLKTQAKAEAPRSARKAVLARGAGKGSALLAAGRKKKKAATTAKRKR
jgi:colicin import membrane protein